MIATAVALAERRGSATREEVSVGLSAVICTRERPEQLTRAIQSLLVQVQSPAEIIVIDNAPQRDGTRRVVERFPTVRYVPEERAGLDFARNRALRTATQEIVAFLDDDAVADTRWSKVLLGRFQEDPALVACTGRVEALSTEHAGQQITEQNGGYSRGVKPIMLPRDAAGTLRGWHAPLIAWTVSSGSGCSLAVKRAAALAIDGFDVALGTRSLPGGDDHDMLWRLLAAGGSIGYEPAALAWHEHRHDARAAYDQIVGHQRGLTAFLAKATMYGSLSQRTGVFCFLLWRLLKPGVRIARRAAGRDPLPVGVLLRMWWNCWRGIVTYPVTRMALRRID